MEVSIPGFDLDGIAIGDIVWFEFDPRPYVVRAIAETWQFVLQVYPFWEMARVSGKLKPHPKIADSYSTPEAIDSAVGKLRDIVKKYFPNFTLVDTNLCSLVFNWDWMDLVVSCDLPLLDERSGSWRAEIKVGDRQIAVYDPYELASEEATLDKICRELSYQLQETLAGVFPKDAEPETICVEVLGRQYPFKRVRIASEVEAYVYPIQNAQEDVQIIEWGIERGAKTVGGVLIIPYEKVQAKTE